MLDHVSPKICSQGFSMVAWYEQARLPLLCDLTFQFNNKTCCYNMRQIDMVFMLLDSYCLNL